MLSVSSENAVSCVAGERQKLWWIDFTKPGNSEPGGRAVPRATRGGRDWTQVTLPPALCSELTSSDLKSQQGRVSTHASFCHFFMWIVNNQFLICRMESQLNIYWYIIIWSFDVARCTSFTTAQAPEDQDAGLQSMQIVFCYGMSAAQLIWD